MGDMMRGRIWVCSEPQEDGQEKFGQTVSIVITDPDDADVILAKFGPYTVKENTMITHSLLVGDFNV